MNVNKFLIGYNPGTHSKINPFEFKGTHEDFLKIRHHDDLEPTLNDPGSLWIKDYISFKCIDCGKETIAQVNSIFKFHRETLRELRDPIQDNFLCGWCKSKRITQRDYGVDNPNLLRDYVTGAKARKEKELEEKIKKKEAKLSEPQKLKRGYSTLRYTKENPYFWEGTYEDLLKVNFKTTPSINSEEYVAYYCKECGKYTVYKLARIKRYHVLCERRGLTMPDDLYCQRCKEKKANLELYGYESYSSNPEKMKELWGENGTFWDGDKKIKYQEDPIFLNDWNDFKDHTYNDKQRFIYKCYDCKEEVNIGWSGLHSRLRNLPPEEREHLYCHSCSIRHTTRPNYYESEEPYPINKPEDLYAKDFWKDQKAIFHCENCGKEEIKTLAILKEQYETKGHLYCASCSLSESGTNVFLNSIIGTSKEPLTSKEKLEEFFKKYPKRSLRFYLDKLNEDFKDNEDGQIYRGTLIKYVERYGLNDYIRHCGVSFEEEMMEEFLTSFIPKETIVRRSQKIIPPLELDFYMPDKGYALEFNGNYWHSDEYINQTRQVSDQYDNYGRIYHQNKSLRCLTEKNIRLIHIYEYIWNEYTHIKREDLSNYIKKILTNDESIVKNLYETADFEIRDISAKEARDFIVENSLNKRFRPRKDNLGLFFDNELYAIFSVHGDYKELHIDKFEYKYSCQTSFNLLFEYLVKDYWPEKVYYKYDMDIPIPLDLWKEDFGYDYAEEPVCIITNNKKVFTPEQFEAREDLKDKKNYYKIYNAGSLIFSWENEEIVPEEDFE